MIIIGIDPGSDKHGVAVYIDGKLEELHMMQLLDIAAYMDKINPEENEVLFSIEDVCANNFVYGRNQKQGKANQSVARAIGMVQQAQKELMRLLDRAEIKYVLHVPQMGNWANHEKTFKRLTGWEGRSNKDKRAAAFFGFLEINP